MNISGEIRWSRRSQLKLAGVEYAQFYGLLTTCGAGLPRGLVPPYGGQFARFKSPAVRRVGRGRGELSTHFLDLRCLFVEKNQRRDRFRDPT